jgi:hypothetical protein
VGAGALVVVVVEYVGCAIGAVAVVAVDVVVVVVGGLLTRPVKPRLAYICARCVRYESYAPVVVGVVVVDAGATAVVVHVVEVVGAVVVVGVTVVVAVVVVPDVNPRLAYNSVRRVRYVSYALGAIVVCVVVGAGAVVCVQFEGTGSCTTGATTAM